MERIDLYWRMEKNQDSGLYVGLYLSLESEQQYLEWLETLPIPKKHDIPHSTLIYSTKTINWEPLKYEPPIGIDPVTYKFMKFGEFNEILVLSFSNEFIINRHNLARQMGATWDYPEFIPHITLTYNCNSELDYSLLDVPTFPLWFDCEFDEPLNLEAISR
jgi:hypothetical protein